MPTEKRVKGVVIPRHDTMLNWSKALNFVPAKGELIVYDADSAEVVASGYDVSSIVIGTTSYSITPSDKPRFKFGNGVDNVNVLPFAAAQADGYVTYDEMVAYVSEHGGTGGDDSQIIVYLNEERVMGRAIQMDDVYPLQNDMEFEIRSQNLLDKSNYAVDNYIAIFNDIELPTEGNFSVYSFNGNAVLNLYNDTILVLSQELSTGSYYSFNAKDLGVNRVVVTCATTDIDSLQIQFESGLNANNGGYTDYTTNLSGIDVKVYGRNILDPNSVLVTQIDSSKTIYCGDSNQSVNVDSIGQKYFNCTGYGALELATSEENPDNNISILNTPGFPEVVDYTVLFNVLNITDGIATLGNFQVVLGHVTEAPYEEYLCNIVTSDENGQLSNEFVQYPYCTALLDHSADTESVAIYAKYDPAINQETIDSQFKEINKRLDALEAGGVVIAESQAGTSATEWTYTVSSNNIFIGGVNANYNATITTAEERVQAINAAFPVTFAYTPAVTITLSNTDGDEHWIESQTVTATALQDVKFAMLAAESATISGTLNITVIGVVA